MNLNYPGVDPTTNITSSNSVSGNQVVGIVIGPEGTFSFQATVNIGFQLSNVISGNGGNGIGLYGANDNQIAMNDIGTDVTGTLDRGNAGNGILVTGGVGAEPHRRRGDRRQRPDGRRVRPAAAGQPDLGQRRQRRAHHRRRHAEPAERQLRRHRPPRAMRRWATRLDGVAIVERQRQFAASAARSSKTRSSSTT